MFPVRLNLPQPLNQEKTIVPSFDIVSEVDKQEVKNAIDQVNKEVTTRFDFKGSDARVEQADYTLTVYADDDFKLSQVLDILMAKLAKRGVDVRCLDEGKSEKISGNKVKQQVTVKTGVESELAKKIISQVQSVIPCKRRYSSSRSRLPNFRCNSRISANDSRYYPKPDS